MKKSMMEPIGMIPVGIVRNQRKNMEDDNWGVIESVIELSERLPADALEGIEAFSHLEIIFYFDRSVETITGSGHPRGNISWPRVGIFAQRKKDRPNHIGTSIVRLLERKDKKLWVQRLDAIDGTPVLDIKPVMMGFLPEEEIRQPSWADELMKNYW